jgi:hypothetical protein
MGDEPRSWRGSRAFSNGIPPNGHGSCRPGRARRPSAGFPQPSRRLRRRVIRRPLPWSGIHVADISPGSLDPLTEGMLNVPPVLQSCMLRRPHPMSATTSGRTTFLRPQSPGVAAVINLIAGGECTHPDEGRSPSFRSPPLSGWRVLYFCVRVGPAVEDDMLLALGCVLVLHEGTTAVESACRRAVGCGLL